MKEIIKKQKILFSVVIFLLANGLIFNFIIRPLIWQIKAGNDKVQEKITEYEINKKRMNDIESFKSQYELIQAEEKNLIFPLEEEKAVELIERLEKVAEMTNNKILIEVKEKEDKKAVPARSSSRKKPEEKEQTLDPASDNYLQIKIILTGSYQNFLSFLTKMEEIEYYSDVIAIDISSNRENFSETTNETTSPLHSSKRNEAVAEKPVNINRETILDSTLNIVFYLAK